MPAYFLALDSPLLQMSAVKIFMRLVLGREVRMQIAHGTTCPLPEEWLAHSGMMTWPIKSSVAESAFLSPIGCLASAASVPNKASLSPLQPSSFTHSFFHLFVLIHADVEHLIRAGGWAKDVRMRSWRLSVAS